MSPLAFRLKRKTENRHFKDRHDNAFIPTELWMKWISLWLVVCLFGQVCALFRHVICSVCGKCAMFHVLMYVPHPVIIIRVLSKELKCIAFIVSL
jgi:hypothetical protein